MKLPAAVHVDERTEIRIRPMPPAPPVPHAPPGLVPGTPPFALTVAPEHVYIGSFPN